MNPILRTRIVSTEAAGSLQVLLNDDILWRTDESLEYYLEKDQEVPMAYGGRLSRWAIISDDISTYFVWTAHHVLYDGWSQAMIFDQVQQMYNEGTIPTPLPFNHFINYLSSGDSVESEKFWISQLSGEMPVVFPQLPSNSYTPRADKVFTHSMHIARNPRSEIMMSTILRAAWAILLARYSDSEDIIFGATLSGRNSNVPRITEIVGPTITTVPVRMVLDFERGSLDFLEAVQAQATDMIPHEHFGLQNISRLSKNAKFQNLLVIQPGSGSQLDFLGTTSVPVREDDFSTFALVMECTLGEGIVNLKVSCDTHIVENAHRMLRHFEQLIRHLNEGKDVLLKHVDMFSPADNKQVWKWGSKYPERIDQTIHGMFSKRVILHPDAPAICAWDASFSFHELDRLSTQLAFHLANLGIRAESIVPLCFEKSAWTTVAMLAILKAGGAFCLLDPAHPVKRLEEIVHAIGATILLCSPTYSSLLTVAVDSVFVVSKNTLESIGPKRRRSLNPVNPRDAAYVVFTSGTTGKPKGSVTEHSSFVTSSFAHGNVMQISSSSRVLQFSAYSFDPCILETFTTLMRGGCVCVLKEDTRTNPNALVKTMEDMKVNWATITPSLARLIEKDKVPSLKTIVLGGEGMAKSDREWARQVHLLNAYGPR